jgi:hypothetical protein
VYLARVLSAVGAIEGAAENDVRGCSRRASGWVRIDVEPAGTSARRGGIRARVTARPLIRHRGAIWQRRFWLSASWIGCGEGRARRAPAALIAESVHPSDSWSRLRLSPLGGIHAGASWLVHSSRSPPAQKWDAHFHCATRLPARGRYLWVLVQSSFWSAVYSREPAGTATAAETNCRSAGYSAAVAAVLGPSILERFRLSPGVHCYGNSSDRRFSILRANHSAYAARARADPLGGIARRKSAASVPGRWRCPIAWDANIDFSAGWAVSRRRCTSPLDVRRRRGHAWVLFLTYGIFFGSHRVELERALVADLVGQRRSAERRSGWYNLRVSGSAHYRRRCCLASCGIATGRPQALRLVRRGWRAAAAIVLLAVRPAGYRPEPGLLIA